MELTEAVRIVREQTIPALAGSGGCGHVAALGTVLAALEQAQPCTHMEGYVERLEAERDALQAERNTLRGAIEVWQREAQSAQAEAEHERHEKETVADASQAIVRHLRAERDALSDKLSSVTEDYIKERNAATAAEAERDALRAALRELIRGIDAWDAAVAQIIERHVNHKWEGLERAREILRDTAPEVKP